MIPAYSMNTVFFSIPCASAPLHPLEKTNKQTFKTKTQNAKSIEGAGL